MESSVPINFKLCKNLNGGATPLITANLNEWPVEIVRLLDPEFAESWVSVGRIFLARGLSLAQGLHRFALRLPRYSLDVSSLAPFEDIWMPLSDAQGVARSLQCDRLLLGFFANRSAWSLVDVEKGEVLHNWRNPEIDPSRYSMHALSTTPCVALHALSLRQQLATQYTAEDIVMPGSLDKLFANFASWASSAYEDFQDDSSKTPIRDAQAYRSDIWKSVNAMLPLLYGEAATTMPKREYRVEGSFCIARRDFMNDNALGSNFLPDVLAKLAVSMIVKANKPGQSAEPEMTSKSTAVSENTNINIDNRLTCIEERLERLADALQQRQASDVCDLKSLLRPLSPALIVLLLGLVLFFYTDRQPCIS